MEKLENKLIDMREMYQERKEKGLNMKVRTVYLCAYFSLKIISRSH